MTYSVHTDCSRPQRVKNWFNNHSGPRNPKNRAHPYSRSICTTIRALLAGDNANINRPKQKLQPTQAYSALYWQKKLKAIVDNEWADKVVSEPELKKKSGAYLRYMNMRLGQMLKDETTEVKAEVEHYRNNRDMRAPVISPLLMPHEEDLPEDERERLKKARKRQRYVSRDRSLRLY